MIPLIRQLERQEGAATTEFAILLAPLLITLLYSMLFVDLVEVKLKSLELARFVAWESVVYRDPATVKQEAEQRFANLRSTDLEGADKNNLFSLDGKNIKVTASLDPGLDVEMAGSVPGKQPSDDSGFLGTMDRSIDAVLSKADLPSKGMARSEVSVEVETKLIPDTRILNTELKAEEIKKPLTFSSHHVLVYDTWKAWPNPNNMKGFTDTETSPEDTYPVAERLVGAQVTAMAFLTLNDNKIMGKVNKFIDIFGLPPPFATGAFVDDEEDGNPTTLRPVATRSQDGIKSFSPSYGRNDAFRFGNKKRATPAYADNPDWGIDHYRRSVPFGPWKNGGHWYSQDGGYNLKKWKQRLVTNDYVRTFECRGHYYEGQVVPDGKPGDYRNYNGCGDKVDDVQSKFGGKIEKLFGFKLPSL